MRSSRPHRAAAGANGGAVSSVTAVCSAFRRAWDAGDSVTVMPWALAMAMQCLIHETTSDCTLNTWVDSCAYTVAAGSPRDLCRGEASPWTLL